MKISGIILVLFISSCVTSLDNSLESRMEREMKIKKVEIQLRR